MRVLIASIAALLMLAVPAVADQQIQAANSKVYANPQVTIAQGEPLTFRNGDTLMHDVTSTQDLDGKPLFSTPLVKPGQSAVVEGSQYLTSGVYPFYCSVHPDMEGTLTVSGDGTPVPRAGGTAAGGATLAAVPARLRAVRRTHALKVKVSGEAGADAIVAASATIAGKRVKLARTRVTLASADPQVVVLELSAKARRALRHVRSVRVTFKTTVLATAGFQTARTKRTYR